MFADDLQLHLSRVMHSLQVKWKEGLFSFIVVYRAVLRGAWKVLIFCIVLF
jgi:hypothetical protein